MIGGGTGGLGPAFQHRQYMFRRKVLKLLGGAFHIYDEAGNLVFYGEQKAFKLREDMRVYADEGKKQELLVIKTPKILDISATYNVTDATTGQAVGALKRKGLKSIVIDEWIFLSTDGKEIGILRESNWIMALLTRYVNLIPQSYRITAGNTEVAMIKQAFNPMVLKYTMSISEATPSLDPRLLIAAGVLLCIIERRQG